MPKLPEQSGKGPNRVTRNAANKSKPPKPPITKKLETLNYKEAARQIRAVERLNKERTPICYVDYEESMKAKDEAIKPAIVEIKGPELRSKDRRGSKVSVQTITSGDQNKPNHPLSKIACVDVASNSSEKMGKKKELPFRSSNSNYRGWVSTVALCEQSDTTTSFADITKPPPLKTSTETTPYSSESVSREMQDHAHMPSKEAQCNIKGRQWKKPCQASIVAGIPPRYTGTCPPTMKQIASMSKERQKFFLTQDPRYTHCLVNPDNLRSRNISENKEFNEFFNLVKASDNICTVKKIEQAVPIICKVIDVENPMGFDFQGLDYKNTYELDEQNLMNNRLYRRLGRHMDRKRAKVETQEKVEEDLQNERLAIPARYNVQDRHEVVQIAHRDTVQLGKLYRSADKPKNKALIENELKERRERYKDLYLRKKEREENVEKKAKIEAEEAEEMIGATVALRNFDQAVSRIEDVIKLAVKGEKIQERKTVERKKYPHTINETRVFKQKLKQENRLRHDRAFVKQQFYREKTGTEKDYPELHVENFDENLPCDQQFSDNSQSESSDDEDDMDVGQVDDRFMLRGFHFKLSQNMRGKIHQRQKNLAPRKKKGCVTRDQWLNELAPKKRRVRLDVKVGIIKERIADDPELELFLPERGRIKLKKQSSAVKNFVKRRLGKHYERNIRRKLKIIKPRLPYHVKKFNLIRFLYSESDRRLEAMKTQDQDKDLITAPLTSTLDYIHERDAQQKIENEKNKRQRMRLLGIPCVEPKIKTSQILCEPSDTESDSDWVPEREPDVEGSLAEYEKRRSAGYGNMAKLPMAMQGNMPAPKYRESTLRRHPRHPRDYANLRVPSEIFHEAVQKSGVPHMRKLKPDERIYENVKLPKRSYTRIFEARHHHDHWNPIQTNAIDVQYQPKVIKPEITDDTLNKAEKIELATSFEKANPPCKEFIDQDLITPNYDIKGMIKKHRAERKQTDLEEGQLKLVDLCVPKDFVFHSRDPNEMENIDYPGRQEYLDFLNEIRVTLDEKKKALEDENDQQLCIDKPTYIEELEADLKSIESCLTSASSSICTNLTNDSGSFLLMEGTTKVPLDFIRKAEVPFEELQRSRFKVVPIDCDTEEANPFRVMPFSGQKRAQAAITTGKDNFFTFTTRLRNGLRLRLETPIIDVRRKLIGRKGNKHFGAVTTDIDENYVHELKTHPPVKYFQFKTGRDYIKNGLRLKFESMVIQGQLVRAKIYDRLNELHWQAMQKTRVLYEKLFTKWEKREYEAAMSIIYRVKTFYEMTDTLRHDFKHLEHQLTVLNMEIVYIESIWIRRIMLQNFHYLLGDREWRLEHDWIHRLAVEEGSQDENGEPVKYELEDFSESIAKRNTVNIRNREKDDARAIKTYFEEVYLPNKHPILIVFPDAPSFLHGIENLKTKTYMLLLELHLTMSVHSELQGRLQTFEEWCMQELKEKQAYVTRKCSKKYFMEDRADELMRRTLDYLEGPIEESYNDPNYNHDRAVIAEVWRQIVPATQRGTAIQDVEPCDMVAMMSDVVINLIAAFEHIPVERAREAETKLRCRRAYLRKVSRNAYQTEQRIELEMKKVRRNLEPPYKKPKQVGKLKRSRLRKVVVPEVKPDVHISEHTKFFFRAFHDEGDVMQVADARDSILDVNTMQDQIVPFYFDHFLKLNGYNVNYNFKTQTEQRDGPEIERLQVKSLIPEVMEKIERWETIRKKTMEDNIARNPKMYENVNA